MKASDLTQKDIVLYEYDGQKFPARVIEIYRSSVLVESIDGEYESIEIEEDSIFPVGLTPEILEKNGFTRPNVRVQYFTESTDYYDVDIHEITDSIWCFEYQNCEAHFPPCLILIAHVHELQHALRLCGIEKEIAI